MLSDRRVYHARILGFKRSKIDIFCKKNTRNTRASEYPILNYSTIKSAQYEKSLHVFVARCWNELDDRYKSCESLSIFKSEMKKLLEETIPKDKVNLFQNFRI